MTFEPGPPDLAERGLPGGATVTMAVPFFGRGTTPGPADWPRREVAFIVDPPAGARYDVVQRLAVPPSLVDDLDGRTFACWIDPRDRQCVLVDFGVDA